MITRTNKIYIESRNCDGLRIPCTFNSADEMLHDWESDDPSMGDNEILLVCLGDKVIYSSLGKKQNSNADTLRTADLMEWFL